MPSSAVFDFNPASNARVTIPLHAGSAVGVSLGCTRKFTCNGGAEARTFFLGRIRAAWLVRGRSTIAIAGGVIGEGRFDYPWNSQRFAIAIRLGKRACLAGQRETGRDRGLF